MSEPTKMNVAVTMESHGRRTKVGRLLTLDMVIQWIKLQELDEYTTKGLIELASKYPTQALPLFRKNFNLMLQRVRAKRKLEQRGEIDEQPQQNNEQAECAIQTEAVSFDDAFGKAFKDKKPVQEGTQQGAKCEEGDCQEDWQEGDCQEDWQEGEPETRLGE